MTLDNIIYHFDLKERADFEWIKLVNKACPSVRYWARQFTAEYYEYYDLAVVPVKLIEKYIREHYDFDAIDVGRIVSVARMG